MKEFKAIVKDKFRGKISIVTIEARNKTEAIHDIRRNGYSVNPYKVKESSVFEYIMNETNCNSWDWKEINSIPTNL